MNNDILLRNLPTRTQANKHCRISNSTDAFVEIYHTREEPVTARISVCRIQEYDKGYDDYVTRDYGWIGQDMESEELNAIYMFKKPNIPKGELRWEGMKDNPFFTRGDNIYEMRKKGEETGIWIVNVLTSETEVKLIAESLNIETPFIELAHPFKNRKTGRPSPLVQWVVMGKNVKGFCFLKVFPAIVNWEELETLPYEKMKCLNSGDKIEHNGIYYDVRYEKGKGTFIC